ncbi:pumilio homolog 12-like [Telopea speciosissima]|uniref:pumilio homolog 12-like n=1 Tax=Telopea speciosissima TaxID=54955 RepID=UPI001CC7C80F|nr:pumilio homolog 12-like [Telopea speciosissima]
MERRSDGEELAKLWGEIPVATSPSSVVDHPSWRQFLYLNNNITNTNNNSIAYPAVNENPFSLEKFSQHSIDPASARLVSLPSSHQSPFVSSAFPSFGNGVVSGASVLDNPAITDTLIGHGQGYPSLFYQQLQETVNSLQRLRLQEAIAGQMAAIMRARAPPSVPESFAVPGSNPISIIDEPCRKFFNVNDPGVLMSSATAASVNGCGKSCCRYQPRNKCCLQLPRPSSQEYAKRSPMMPCSNGNGFRLDSNGHCRVAAVDGQLLETDNQNILMSPFFNQSLNHLQPQQPMYSSLEDLRGQMVALAKDQHGCRFLQKKFEEGRVDEIEMIFAEVKDHVGELMVHPFGNYLVQRLLEVCTEEQKMEVLCVITKKEFQLVTICLDIHGTRAVQKMLEHLTTPEQISCVMMALRPGTVILSKDVNGHHVIQNCLQRFSHEDNKYLLNTVADHSVEIATDSSGCCVLQLCVGHAQGESREHLFAEITANATVLARDPYGNYVVQYILGLKIPHVMAAVLRQLEGSYISLSLQKFSSHVVEKCLKESTEEQSSKIIKELLSSSKFIGLLEDAYGNYVVQSALLVAKGDTYKAIVDLVQSRIPSMRSNPYGKRILDRINARR